MNCFCFLQIYKVKLQQLGGLSELKLFNYDNFCSRRASPSCCQRLFNFPSTRTSVMKKLVFPIKKMYNFVKYNGILVDILYNSAMKRKSVFIKVHVKFSRNTIETVTLFF